MAIDDQIRDEKLQYDINREAAKISTLSSNKIGKYEYFTGEEILSFDKEQIIEQAKFTNSPLRKAFEKQIKTIEDQRNKQVEDLKHLKPKEKKNATKDTADNKVSIQKGIYNKLQDGRTIEIQDMA